MVDRSDETRLERLAMWQRRCLEHSDHRESFNECGGLLAVLGRHQEAIPYFERAIALDLSDFKDCMNLGITLRTLGRLDEAIAWLRESVRRNPSYASGWEWLGRTLIDRGAPQEAMDALDQGIAARHNSPTLWELKAGAFTAMGGFQEAASCAHYGQFLRGDPSLASQTTRLQFWQARAGGTPADREAWLEAGRLLIKMQRWPEALEAIDRSIAADEKWEESWFSRGEVLAQMGRTEEAIGAFRRAGEANPRLPVPWIKLATMLKAANRNPEAIEAFKAATAAQYNLPEAWVPLAGLHEKAKQWPEAGACYRAAVEVSPRDATAWYGVGLASGRKNDWAGAAAAYDKAVQLGAKQVVVRGSRSVAMRNLGRFDEAVEDARASVGPPPGRPVGLYLLAEALELAGRRQEALATCDALTRVAPKDLSGVKLKAKILSGGGAAISVDTLTESRG